MSVCLVFSILYLSLYFFCDESCHHGSTIGEPQSRCPMIAPETNPSMRPWHQSCLEAVGNEPGLPRKAFWLTASMISLHSWLSDSHLNAPSSEIQSTMSTFSLIHSLFSTMAPSIPHRIPSLLYSYIKYNQWKIQQN